MCYTHRQTHTHFCLCLTLVSAVDSQKDILSRDKDVVKLEAQLQETKALLDKANTSLSKQRQSVQEWDTITGEVTISTYIWCKNVFLEKLKSEVAEKNVQLQETKALLDEANISLTEGKYTVLL